MIWVWHMYIFLKIKNLKKFKKIKNKIKNKIKK